MEAIHFMVQMTRCYRDRKSDVTYGFYWLEKNIQQDIKSSTLVGNDKRHSKEYNNKGRPKIT